MNFLRVTRHVSIVLAGFCVGCGPDFGRSWRNSVSPLRLWDVDHDGVDDRVLQPGHDGRFGLVLRVPGFVAPRSLVPDKLPRRALPGTRRPSSEATTMTRQEDEG